jgi:hypothetical protein
LVIDRLDLLAEKDISDLCAIELVKLGYCDPVRVFTKQEPHSTSKIRTGRMRQIFAVSIVDQLVERLLCADQNKREIALWDKIPSAPGLGLSDDNQLKGLYERIQILRGDTPAAEADIEGWDWSMKEWQMQWEAKARATLGNFSERTTLILKNRYHCVAHSVYTMPDAKLVVLKEAGVQLSGCYNTSSTNSRLRVLIAYLIGARWALAMGDDCVEDSVVDAQERYLALGHRVKMYNERTDEFEFCSNLFTDRGAWPVDGTKTLFRLLEQRKISPELIAQFRQEMRNSPRLHEFLQSVERVLTAGGQ